MASNLNSDGLQLCLKHGRDPVAEPVLIDMIPPADSWLRGFGCWEVGIRNMTIGSSNWGPVGENHPGEAPGHKKGNVVQV